jgi:cysteinyl-tRNA synthetase
MSNTLKLYNTLTRSKEVFTPLDPSNVRMYVCGPTVYDNAHIGNARPVIVFDVLFRLLRHIYGKDQVTYARNITDVDDKINARAFERWNRTGSLTQEIRKLTDVTLAQFHKDIDALGVLRDGEMLEPRATDFVANDAYPLDMVRIIEKLIARGHAYAAEGHVLFDVPSMPDYGRLARRNSDDMIAGARVDVAPYKKSPMDFVLWKPSDPATEPGWESPWGYGRPGWHIECSAMSGALLGQTFDIHAGGLDLIFPHHENEIAQSRCAFGTASMASVWMHNGFLQVEGQKMSKSLGNFVTIDDLLHTTKFGGRSWPGEVLRLAMLKTHYRQPIDWTLRGLEEAEAVLSKYRNILWSEFGSTAASPEFWEELDEWVVSQPGDGYPVITIISEDLNTPQAFVYLDEVSKEWNRQKNEANVNSKATSAKWLAWSLRQLGIVQRYWFAVVPHPDHITTLINTRNAARAAKNFAESDRLRAELEAMGLQLKDGKDEAGNPVTTWEVKR